MIEELRARAQLLIEERKLIATVAQREHRAFSEDELEKLARLNGAIQAVLLTINELSPPTPPVAAQQTSPTQNLDDYRLMAGSYHAMQKESFKFAMEQVGLSGRWLIATVAAAHLGGIWALVQISPSVTSRVGLEDAAWAFVIGLVLIFFSGLVAYWNWSANASHYAKHLDVNYLVNPTHWPKSQSLRVIVFTQWVALVAGALSVACLPIGAWLLFADKFV